MSAFDPIEVPAVVLYVLVAWAALTILNSFRKDDR